MKSNKKNSRIVHVKNDKHNIGCVPGLNKIGNDTVI